MSVIFVALLLVTRSSWSPGWSSGARFIVIIYNGNLLKIVWCFIFTKTTCVVFNRCDASFNSELYIFLFVCLQMETNFEFFIVCKLSLALPHPVLLGVIYEQNYKPQ